MEDLLGGPPLDWIDDSRVLLILAFLIFPCYLPLSNECAAELVESFVALTLAEEARPFCVRTSIGTETLFGWPFCINYPGTLQLVPVCVINDEVASIQFPICLLYHSCDP